MTCRVGKHDFLCRHTCGDCLRLLKYVYMVKDEIWEMARLRRLGDVVCITCLKKRLLLFAEHELVPVDFSTTAPCNGPIHASGIPAFMEIYDATY